MKWAVLTQFKRLLLRFVEKILTKYSSQCSFETQGFTVLLSSPPTKEVKCLVGMFGRVFGRDKKACGQTEGIKIVLLLFLYSSNTYTRSINIRYVIFIYKKTV